MGSNFGTWNEIRDACAAEPFVDEAAPSDACTGASISRFNMSSFLHSICTLDVFFNIYGNFSFNEKVFEILETHHSLNTKFNRPPH